MEVLNRRDHGEGFACLKFCKKFEDWRWLVAKFERKISFWCNKWLSLGGRFILVNSVLQSLSVFWMSLEKIPSSILKLLRRLSFNFLWNGQNDKHVFTSTVGKLYLDPFTLGTGDSKT
jgi:hypothetical protein